MIFGNSFFQSVLWATFFLAATMVSWHLFRYLSGKKWWRKICHDLHLWLGMITGLLLFIICLTGTILTFKNEIVLYFDHNIYYVMTEKNVVPMSPEQLVEHVERKLNGRVTHFEFYSDSSRSYLIYVKPENIKPSHRPSGIPSVHADMGTAYLVNQYTGEILGPRMSKTYGFFMAMMFLHRFLLLDIATGQLIVGTVTIVFTVIVLSGLFLWLPVNWKNKKAWKIGFNVRVKSGWGRFLYDTHNTLGFYSLIPLMIMAVTGPCLSFEWYRDTFAKTLNANVFRGIDDKQEHSIPSNAPTVPKRSLNELIVTGKELTQQHGRIRVTLPTNPNVPVLFRATAIDQGTFASGDHIQLDQYTGKVLNVELYHDFSWNEKIAATVMPLHTGEVFGTIGKWIYFIACLIATTLPATGTWLWFQKLKSRWKKRRLGKEKMTSENKESLQQKQVA